MTVSNDRLSSFRIGSKMGFFENGASDGATIVVDQLTDFILVVDRNQAVALPRVRPLTLCALEQTVWLTQQGQARDMLLARGECITLQRRGLLVVQALGGSSLVRVQLARRRTASWRRHAARLAGSAAKAVAAMLACRRPTSAHS